VVPKIVAGYPANLADEPQLSERLASRLPVLSMLVGLTESAAVPLHVSTLLDHGATSRSCAGLG
jgi:hypothetical protein